MRTTATTETAARACTAEGIAIRGILLGDKALRDVISADEDIVR